MTHLRAPHPARRPTPPPARRTRPARAWQPHTGVNNAYVADMARFGLAQQLHQRTGERDAAQKDEGTQVATLRAQLVEKTQALAAAEASRVAEDDAAEEAVQAGQAAFLFANETVARLERERQQEHERWREQGLGREQHPAFLRAAALFRDNCPASLNTKIPQR